MILDAPIAPPAPKAAAATTTQATDTTAATTATTTTQATDASAAVTTQTAATTTQTTQDQQVVGARKPKEKPGSKFVKRLADLELAADAQAATAETDKTAATKTADTTSTTTATDPDSDDAIKADAEKNFKNDPAQKKAWTELRYKERDQRRQLKEKAEAADKASKEVETLRTELEAARKQPVSAANSEDITTLKAQIEAAQKRATDAEAAAQAKDQELAAAAVERSDAFQQAVSKPMSAIESRAKELAKKYELSERTVLAALHGSSEEQDEVSGAMKPADSVKFLADAVKVSELNEKAEVLRTNAKEALAKLEERKANETETQKKQRFSDYTQAHETNWKALQEQVPILKPMDGEEADVKTWNNGLADLDKFARETDFSALDVPTQNKVMLRAGAFPMLVGANNSYKAQIDTLTATVAEQASEIAKLRKNGGSADTEVTDGGTTTPEPPKPGTAGKRLAESLRAKGVVK